MTKSKIKSFIINISRYNFGLLNMAGKQSKDKGSSAERELCKMLGSTFGGAFIRSANSGAFLGGKNAGRRIGLGKAQLMGAKGDIVPPDFMPNLVIESKWYAEFQYHNLLTPGEIPLLENWLSQTLDAVDDGDFWMLCFRANRRAWSVALDIKYASQLNLENYCSYQKKVIITDFEQFINNNKELILSLSAPAI